jgi:hypothetical protein
MMSVSLGDHKGLPMRFARKKRVRRLVSGSTDESGFVLGSGSDHDCDRGRVLDRIWVMTVQVTCQVGHDQTSRADLKYLIQVRRRWRRWRF